MPSSAAHLLVMGADGSLVTITPPDPLPPVGGLWHNGYAVRQEIVIDPAASAVSGFILPVALDLTGQTERSDGGDLRFELADQIPLPYHLAGYNNASKAAWAFVRLPSYPGSSRLTVYAYTGKASATGEADAATTYAGYLQAIDPVSGSDLTGQGRSGTPSGVIAGSLTNGWPCGVYDGTDAISSSSTVPWLDGLEALSIASHAELDPAWIGTAGAIWRASATASGNSSSDTAALQQLPTSSGGGETNLLHVKAHVTGGFFAYAVGDQDSAISGAQTLVGSVERNVTPVIYRNGAAIPPLSATARDALTAVNSDGWHVGGALKGKLASIRVRATAMGPIEAALDHGAFFDPGAFMGRGAWYGPEDVGDPPVVAMPLSGNVQAGSSIDFDVLTASIGGASITAVTQGSRSGSAAAIVSGQVRYTPGGTGSGIDRFTATLSDGTFLSTCQLDVTISAAAGGGSELFEQLPAATSTVTVSTLAALQAALLVAPAGRHILVAAGNYGTGSSLSNLHALDAPNGTQAQPVIVRAADPSNPPVFLDRYDIGRNSQTRVQFWGCVFDDTAFGSQPDRRLFRLWNAPDCGLYYCDIKSAGIGVEVNTLTVIGTRMHRCRWHGQPNGGNNGKNAIKAGISISLTTDHATLIDYCLIEGYDDSRETVSGKGRLTMRRCHMTGCKDIATRHVRSCVIEECRLEGADARIQINGPDHIVRGCVTPEIEIWRGTHDGDATVDGTGGLYLAGTRTILQNNTCPSIRIGEYPFGDAGLGGVQAVGTLVSGNSSTPVSVNGATWGTAPTVTTATPPTLNSTLAGVGAYPRHVIAAMPVFESGVYADGVFV